MGGRLTALVEQRAAVFTAVLAGGALILGPGRPTAATPPAEDSRPACTAEAIGADTGVPLRPEVLCSAGFAMAMLAPPEPGTAGPTATVNETNSCTSLATCMYRQIFHITTSGWVHDGVHGAACAEDLGVYFMSPQTAATFAAVCEPETWPVPPTVQEGDHGVFVMYVQIALVNAGYDEAVDGSFGSGTTAAVRLIQYENGLEMTGIVGPEIHALLGTGPNPPLPPTTTTTTTSTTAAPPSTLIPGDRRPCTVDSIAADTGLPVASIAGCAAGWSLGLLSTTCPPHPDEPDIECEAGDLFHVTADGWVYDGSVYPFCADLLAETEGVSVHTALTWSPVCGDEPIPERTNIEPGTSGQRVNQLQIALVALGYPIAVDGEYGPRTEAAVRDVQQRNGLEVDGVAGPQTQEALGI